MANFNEHSLEMSIMELFQDEGYVYLNGEQIHRERSEVLLIDDLRKSLLNRYAAEGLTASEVDSIILRLVYFRYNLRSKQSSLQNGL